MAWLHNLGQVKFMQDKVNPFQRTKVTGRPTLRLLEWRRSLRSAILLSVVAILQIPQIVSAASPPDIEESASELMVVFDPRVPAAEIDQNLLDAGFKASTPIEGLSPGLSVFRSLSVPSTTELTRQELMSVSGVAAVRPVFLQENYKHPIYMNGQVVVRFDPGSISLAEVKEMTRGLDSIFVREISGLPGAYVVQVIESRRSVRSVASAFRADPRVRYSHASTMFRLVSHQAANQILDPLFPFQWHLNNTGQLEGAVPGADINVFDAWENTLGEGATVAVLDDCVQRDHEDLAENYLTGSDFAGAGILFVIIVDEETDEITIEIIEPEFDDDPSPFYGPDPTAFDPIGDYHGTSVSGIIAAAPNTIGVRGVAPRSNLIGIRIGIGDTFTSDQAIADAFLFAEANGAQIINNSWGGPGGPLFPLIPNDEILFPSVISDAITEVATNGRGGLGVAVFYSSGNDNTFIDLGNAFAALKHTIAVGATLRDDTLACYSNFGPEQSVVAPGGGSALPSDFPTILELILEPEVCLENSIATTDNERTIGRIRGDFDLDGELDEWRDNVGANPAQKFLDVFSELFCISDDDLLCIPLVPDPTALEDFPNTNYTQRFNGTSAACPVAAGTAALVLSVNPSYTAYQLRNLLEHTADKPDRINEEFDAVTGFNERYGHGRVNAGAAVEAAENDLSWPSPVENVVQAVSQDRIQLAWELPDWNNDGLPDGDTAGVIVAVGPTGQVNFTPEDGVEYTVGQEVAPDVEVIARGILNSLDVTGFPTGEFDFAIWTFNADSFYSWGRRVGVETNNPDLEPPLISIRANPTVGDPPLTVLFTAGGVDPNEDGFIEYLWDFDDGTTATGPAAEHTFEVPGAYVVNVEARTPSGGRAFSNVIITVSSEDNVLPTAEIVATPRSGDAPLSVIFEASATDLDGTVVAYEWEFGDGNSAIGPIVENVFLNPGTYAVTLRVTDNRGGTGAAVAPIVVTGVGTTTESAGATAGQTTPAICGAGVAGAASLTFVGLLGMALLHRRRVS